MNCIETLLVALIFSAGELGIDIPYISYFLVLLLFFIRIPSLTLHNCWQPYTQSMLLLVVFSIPWVLLIDVDTMRDSGLILLGISCFLNAKPLSCNVKAINVIMLMATCYGIFKTGSLNLTAENYLHSDIGYESSMLSFIYPFFSIYWAIKKNKVWVLIDLAFGLVSGKRIAFLATLVGIIYVCFLLRGISRRKIQILRLILISMNIAYLLVTFLIISDFFSNFIDDITGMPINQFTMGRYELYNTAINRSNILEGANFIWGIGNGNVLPLLEGARLHNDVLKIFIENGLVVFVLFFVILYQKKWYFAWSFIFVQNVLFFTDNTLIYVPVIFATCLFIDLIKEDYLVNLEYTLLNSEF